MIKISIDDDLLEFGGNKEDLVIELAIATNELQKVLENDGLSEDDFNKALKGYINLCKVIEPDRAPRPWRKKHETDWP